MVQEVVTDPELLKQLNAESSPQPVTDPALLAQLNGTQEKPSRIAQLGSNPLVRGAYGLAEGATNMLTGMGASAVGGIEGINKLLSGGSAEDATKRIQEVQKKYTYQPRTEEGAATVHVAGLPLELAGKVGAWAGRNSELARMTGTTDAAESIGEAAPSVLATLLMGKAALNKSANLSNVTGTANDPYLQAKALREAGNDSMRLDSIAKAKANNLTLNPTAVQKTLTNKTASALIGDTALDKAVAEKNKPVMTAMVKEDIGVPNGVPLSDSVLQARIKEASAPYDEIRRVPAFTPDDAFSADIAAMNDFSNHSPAVQDFLKQNAPKLQAEMQSMAEGGFNGNDVVTLMQKFRKEANSVLSNKAQQSPEALALANAQRTAAKAIEGMVDRNLSTMDASNPGMGYGDLANRFREGRTTIAKIKTIEPFIDGNGNFVPTKAFRLSKNNSSYTDNLKTLSDVSGSFPESFTPSSLSGGPLNVSHSGVLNTIRHIASDPLERYVLSNRYQQKNMSGLDPRELRTRAGYSGVEEPLQSRRIQLNQDIPNTALPNLGNPPVIPQSWNEGLQPTQPRTPLPVIPDQLNPLSEQYPQGIPIGAAEGRMPQQSTPLPKLYPDPRPTMEMAEPQATAQALRQQPSTIDFPLKTEVLQQPEIVKATDAFRLQAQQLQEAISAETNGFKKAQLEAQLIGLQNRFGKGAHLLGGESAADFYGPNYQSGTRFGVEKTFDPKALAEQLRKQQ